MKCLLLSSMYSWRLPKGQYSTTTNSFSKKKKIISRSCYFIHRYSLEVRSFVQAPNTLTIFICFPICTIIFNSEAKALIALYPANLLTILTAAGKALLSERPTTSAFKTTPNAPEPSSFPKCIKSITR
jgi:hypothetical protein